MPYICWYTLTVTLLWNQLLYFSPGIHASYILACDVASPKWKTLHIMAILNLTLIRLEHFLSFKMTPSSLKLVNAIRCYKWNTAGNSYIYIYIFAWLFSSIPWRKKSALNFEVSPFNMLHHSFHLRVGIKVNWKS